MIKSGRGIDMGDGWETARNPNRPSVLEADSKGILQVLRIMTMTMTMAMTITMMMMRTMTMMTMMVLMIM